MKKNITISKNPHELFSDSTSFPHTIMLPLLLSRFSRVRLCATPQTAAHQAPPSLGFSRQEHWRGLPFPPPMQESDKGKWSRTHPYPTPYGGSHTPEFHVNHFLVFFSVLPLLLITSSSQQTPKIAIILIR